MWYYLRSITLLQKLQYEIKKKNTVLKCKKTGFFEKIDKNVQINYLFHGNSFCEKLLFVPAQGR